jgi:predicted NodU family carbamoyl transferase
MVSDILGISAFYHDRAACLIRDGDIVAAAQEERFTRRKHDPGSPSHGVAYCLKQEKFRWRISGMSSFAISRSKNRAVARDVLGICGDESQDQISRIVPAVRSFGLEGTCVGLLLDEHG